jgi:hypothetical protein
MSRDSVPQVEPAEPITLDDLRHKALAIREEVKVETKRTLRDRRTQIVIGVVVVTALAFGVAYYLGSRAGKASAAAVPPTRPV